MYSLNAGASAGNLFGSRRDESLDPFGVTIPRTEWLELNRLKQDVSKKRAHWPCLDLAPWWEADLWSFG